MNDRFKSCDSKKRERFSNSSDSPSPVSKLRKKDPTEVMEDLLKEVKLIRTEIQESEGRITAVIDTRLQSLEELNPKIENLEKKFEDLEKIVQTKIDDTRKNLIIFGYPEDAHEGWREINKLVGDLSRKLKYNRRIDYDIAFRLGPKVHGKRRPVLIKLMRMIDKFEILSLTRNLKGTTISVEEDYTPKERIIKSLLRKKAFDLRKSFPEMRTRIMVRKNELWTSMEGSSTTYEVASGQRVTEKAATRDKTAYQDETSMEIVSHSGTQD